jgi:hypothetical protein
VFVNDGAGVVINFGHITSTSTASGTTIVLEDGGSVTNFGTVQNTDPNAAAIYFHGAGSIINGRTGVSAGSISGAGNAISIRGGSGMIINSGSIKSATANGVYLNSGSVTNQAGGVIAGHSNGIYNRHALIGVTNSGVIETTGTGDGVYLQAGGSITNNAGGVIAGNAAGIVLGQHGGTVRNSGIVKGGVGFYVPATNSGNVTLVNSGRIASTAGAAGRAVEMGGSPGSKLLIVEKGAVFTGLVEGGGRGEIEFASPGTAAMGANISGFETVALADGAADSLTLVQANWSGVSSSRITVIGGNHGNTVNASAVTTGGVTIEGGAGKDVLTGTANGNTTFVLFYSATGSSSNEHLVATLAGSPTLDPAHLLFVS